jgi:hypothetical protein
MIKIKLTVKEIAQLHIILMNWDLPGAGPYYALLREHIAEFVAMFHKLRVKAHTAGTKSCRVPFTSLQCEAFMQIFLGAELETSPAGITILEVIKCMDQQHVSLQVLIEQHQDL